MNSTGWQGTTTKSAASLDMQACSAPVRQPVVPVPDTAVVHFKALADTTRAGIVALLAANEARYPSTTATHSSTGNSRRLPITAKCSATRT